MVLGASGSGGGGAGFEPALDARFAADRRGLRREALLVAGLLAAGCCAWRGLAAGWSALWPFGVDLGIALALAAAPPLALIVLTRWVPARTRRVARLDAELDARGALVAASETAADARLPLPALLRRALARRLVAPLPASACTARRARRRARLVRWALLALLVWLWLMFVGSLLGPGGSAPRGTAGELAGSRAASTGGGSAEASVAEVPSTTGGSVTSSEAPPEPAPGDEPEPEPEQDGRQAEPPPLPPEPERRLEDFFVRLREQASGGSARDLWVVPLVPAEGEGPSEGNGAGEQPSTGAATAPPPFQSASQEDLKRAAERAALPATLSERERGWVARYYAALRKLP